MLKIPKGSRTAAVLVALLVASFFIARHLVSGDGGPPADVPTYAAREADEHVGELGRVCGTVVDAAHVPGARGAPTFLNFGKPHPDAVFTVVIWGDVRARFDVPPESAYQRRRVCVTGRIREHEGRPQIVLEAPSWIGPGAAGGDTRRDTSRSRGR